ncbi:DUF5627 domain-containing protein [uncultured Proteiniphilum sp.]|jgi:hypothetical protein|uniref:DUF5627 domain-containing protein n=1 Tax=uncultured Proteiniphilum sp. TaxID=497637 RepID=UPI001E09F4AA|nr:DUF5627 domain-containing protein [uncultured Proteiniphilum sp.]NLU28445.1 DUF1735 domain-containing protein [Bacteroidales bacterium]
MKKVLLLTLCFAAILSCKNSDIEYEDYDFSSAYFPYQYPVRTLVLGDYIYDNTNDNNHKFLIYAAIGGLYSNKSDRVINFKVDQTLCERALFEGSKDTIRFMPSHYYQLNSPDKVVIPSGKFNGAIEVQLNDAFFQDTLAIKLGYVIPMRLTGSNDVDSILQGMSASEEKPDPRDKKKWEVLPKNFTMFAIKYINEFHGSYLYYGKNKVKDLSGNVVEENVYSEKYVEKNPVVKLVTTGRYQVAMNTFFNSQKITGSFGMLLDFDGKNCTLSAPKGSAYEVTGTGVFQEKKYNWGNKDRDGIEIHYTIKNGDWTYEANDVLVMRDRGVVMELFSPVLY